MTLASGTRLGPYEVVGSLGSGGMGEVYRAQDPRLRREVAVKVLPAEFSEDASRLRRFEKEARSASALNHPNIVTIYDIGAQDGVSYIAMEKVDGSSLREMLIPGAMPARRLFPVAVQIADGLAKAHEAGIVHRDLKPENVMVTKDGIVKILDFGLAKLTGPSSGSDEGSRLPTQTGTSPGVVVGTAGYMSPEQARGERVDFPSDQFSFGSILYEMATGKRAFLKKTGIDTLSAILNDDPEPIASLNPQVPAPLRWIVERCHSKDPGGRYASTRDLARELATVRDHLSEAFSGGVAAGTRPRRRLWPWAAAVAVVAALAAGMYFLGRRGHEELPPSFWQLTYRRGTVYSARFARDGETIVYTAAWDGKPMEIFIGRTESADARPFGLVDAELLAISESGEMAVSLNRILGYFTAPIRREGTLARVPIGGGMSPREVLEKVEWADWAPDGLTLAVVRDEKLEYPVGKKIYENTSDGWLSDARVSPDGELVAVIDHPQTAADDGSVFVVNRAGKSTKLAGPYFSALGLAWSPDGEVWFTASPSGTESRGVYSVSPSGKPRLRARIAGSMRLLDISRQGRLLLTRETSRIEIGAHVAGEPKERDLTWLDWNKPGQISRDGRWVLFTGPSSDFGQAEAGADSGYFVYLRKTDGSPPVRLGEGLASALSPDGKVVLAVTKASAADPDPDLIIYPTGAGEARRLPKTGLINWGFSRNNFLPDGRRFAISAAEPGRDTARVWLRDIDGGKPVPLSPEGYGGGIVSPDGTWLLARTAGPPTPETRYYRCSIPGGEIREIPGLTFDDRPTQISDDGTALFLVGGNDIPRKVYRFDIATGRRELWRTVSPTDLAGVSELAVYPSGGDSYLYEYTRILSDLYLVEGVH